MISYRKDIDGLRAIAVLAVIVFHFKESFLRGGYAGVDIFFVISGFLITSILKRDLYNNNFSIAGFYERRARRILPALFTVIAASLAAFWFSLFPDDYIELAKSVIAATLSFSNIFFWSTIDYFSSASDEKPLLHTWSLGVEEQFYFLFPLILFFLDKYFPEKRVALFIAGFGLASLAFAQYAAYHYSQFAFYWLPSRFWELALGAFIAYLPRLSAPARIKETVSTAGFLMIAAAYAFYTDKTHFPGIAPLLPCLGTGLLLANENTFISRKILSHPAAVFTGRISYSLYLWHWVVLAFWRTRFEEHHAVGGAVALVIIFALSYLSWRFIETPFRKPDFLNRKQVFAASLGGMIVLLTASFAIIHYKGIPERFSAKAFAIANAAQDYKGTVFQKCVEKQNQDDPECIFGDLSQPQNTAIIWGDSHAGANAVLLDAFGKQEHFRGLKMTKSSCPAFTGDYEFESEDYGTCKIFNAKVLAYILAHKEIINIFVSARWAPVAKKLIFNGEKDESSFTRAMEHTRILLEKENRKIFIIASEPETEFSVPRCLSRREAFGDRFFTCARLTLPEYLEQEKAVLPAFSALAEDTPVFYPHSVLCEGGTCRITNGEDILYFDDDHLSRKGSLYLLPGLTKAFAPYLSARH